MSDAALHIAWITHRSLASALRYERGLRDVRVLKCEPLRTEEAFCLCNNTLRALRP